MDLIEFDEQTVVIAKDQPEYRPLPAYQYSNDPAGRIVCCWQLTWAERLRLLFSGKIWHTVMTFRQPLQPQLLQVEKPEMPVLWVTISRMLFDYRWQHHEPPAAIRMHPRDLCILKADENLTRHGVLAWNRDLGTDTRWEFKGIPIIEAFTAEGVEVLSAMQVREWLASVAEERRRYDAAVEGFQKAGEARKAGL